MDPELKDHRAAKSKWALALLWINLSVVVVALVQVATNQITSARELFRLLAYALIYANLTGLLATWILGGLAERWASRKFPLLPAAAAGILIFTTLGCLLAQTLLAVIGFVVPQHFWQEYFRTDRKSVV